MSSCPECSTPGVTSRRSFLRFGLTASAAAAAGVKVPSLLAQETVASARGKSVILLWMGGGPSQIDTWDPKPQNAKTNGPFKALDTAVRGVQFSQHMEQLAAQAKHIGVIRTLTTREAAHERGTALMQTCFAPIPGQDFAAMGTVVAAELTPKKFPLPSFVAVQPPPIPMSDAFDEEFLPFLVNDINRPVPNLQRHGGLSDQRQEEREKLLDAQNESFEAPRGGRSVEKVKASMAKAEDLMTTPLMKAFDIKKEPESLRKEYGTGFGQNCLLARRLVEAGVRFVQVGLGGWDTHDDNFTKVEKLIRTSLDPGMATLIKDLDQKGMLKDTLVLWMGEFGRTPEINGGNGRDHWVKCFSVAMAGCGVGGRVVGATDKAGMEIADRPVTVAELFATVYAKMGIPENKTYIINTRSVKYSYGGKPIREMM